MGQLVVTKEQVELALTDVRQFILSDGGDLEIVVINDYKVQIRLKGACISCPLSLFTVQFGVQKALQEQISNFFHKRHFSHLAIHK